MKYEVILPDEIDVRLAAQAMASGRDVVHLIQLAIVRFVDDVAPPVDLEWSPEMRRRRTELIDKDIAGTITPSELLELADLDQKGNAYYDTVAAPPMEKARSLHQKFLQIRGQH